MVSKLVLFAFCFLLLFLPLVSAEEVSSFDLGKIVISKDQNVGGGSPSSVIVSAEGIETRNAQSVDEALNFVSGVRATVGQKNEPDIVIRGFKQDNILTLLDGIPIASPFYGFVDLNQIAVENISEIKVIKGSASAMYGSNAMAGVVNIISKSPGEKPHLELINGFSANNTRYHTLNYGARFKDYWSLWISGAHRESDGYNLSSDFEDKRNENGQLRENSFYEKDNVSLKIGFEKEKFNLSSYFNYFDNEKGIPGHVSSANPRYWRFTDWKRWMAAFAGEVELTEYLSLKTRFYYDKYNNTLESFDDGSYTTQNQRSSWISTFDESALGSSLHIYLNPNQMHSLSGAFSFRKDIHQEQDDVDEVWEDYGFRTYSLGIEDNVRLNDKLDALIGFSYDILDQQKRFSGPEGKTVGTYNPFLNISYSITPELRAYSSVSKKTRFPTMNELYSNTSGNPDLNEQRNFSSEVGLKCEIMKQASINLSFFYNRLKDLIERASRIDPYQNLYKSVIQGIEADIQSSFGDNFKARVGYCYIDAEDKNPEVLGRDYGELTYIPDHKADFELSYMSDFGLSCALLGAYHGKSFYYDANNVQLSLGDYFVWNSKIAYDFFDNWQGSLFVENIFDANYQEEEGYPQPGRSFTFNLKATF